MAARKKAWTPDKVRERIQSSMITNRLIDHALGKLEMSATQVRAAEILLNKTVPNLTATDLQVEGTLSHRDITDEPLTEDQWAAEYQAVN